MNYHEYHLKLLREKKERVERGEYNGITIPFKRLSQYYPCVEKKKYIIITANQKIGKSKFTDFLFVYNLIFFMDICPSFSFKVLYFSLEVSRFEKYNEFLSHLLYRLDNIVISTTDLNSLNPDKPLPPKVLELLQSDKYLKYIKRYHECVQYIETISNPTGINKYCRDYALSNGHLNYVTKDINDINGIPQPTKVIDQSNPYTPNTDEYRFVIIDNAANLSSEKGMNKRETIMKMSKYNITLRNQLQYTVVMVQHQALNKESLESIKMNQIRPTSEGLADCKEVGRDCNAIIGLYSPFKYGIKEYEGYNITKFKNHIRFLEIVEDRDYGANGVICPLFFNGASSFFKELPLPTDNRTLQIIYESIENRNKKRKEGKLFFSFSPLHLINKLFN